MKPVMDGSHLSFVYALLDANQPYNHNRTSYVASAIATMNGLDLLFKATIIDFAFNLTQ